ncbi:MAG TPA: hypothetical protein VNR36_14135 [Pseudolysinimonas sp.]|nr:hypothetical protein [Pseudolysinimonas sp.]
MSAVRPSPAESARFGLRIARLDGAVLDPAGLARLDPDVVIVRLPEGATPPRPAGYHALDAGLVVTWRGGLSGLTRPPEHPELGAERESDAAVVTGLVREIFVGYRNHYAANPLLDPSAVAEGYAQWASTTLSAGGSAVVLRRAGTPIAVAVLGAGSSPARVDLAGVIESERGAGRYAHLLHAVHEVARASGATEIVISTQAENVRVQRAWRNAGYRPDGRERIVHLVRSSLLPE